MGVPLPDRIRFRPVEGKDGPSYELTVPIAFDRLLVSVIPSLQVRVASLVVPASNQLFEFLSNLAALRAAGIPGCVSVGDLTST